MARDLTIQPTTLKDASFVMAWLRPEDELEVLCQMPAGVLRHEIAYSLLMAGDCFSARWKDQPIAIFGTSPINAACLSVWALGTKDVWRAVPAINRFMTTEHLPDRMRQGYIALEARSHISHASAHRWLEAMGGRRHGEPYEFGKHRELFVTFRWTDRDIERIRASAGKHSYRERISA